jgi:serine/threonine protein kinase
VLPIIRYLSGMREPAGWGVLLAAAMQANDAMCLFEEHGLLHRDLAARNVLVFSFHPRDRSKVLVKLCDYGLVTDESDVARRERAAVGGAGEGGGEEEEEDGPEDLPWRYIPPEVIASRAWSHQSDVWSFGIAFPPHPDC